MLLECVMNVNKLAAKVNDTHIFLSLNVYSHICISLVLTGIAHFSLLEGQDGVSRWKSTIYLALQAYSLGCLQCTCKGCSEHLNYLRPVLIWYFPKHFTSISSLLTVPLGTICRFWAQTYKGRRKREKDNKSNKKETPRVKRWKRKGQSSCLGPGRAPTTTTAPGASWSHPSHRVLPVLKDEWAPDGLPQVNDHHWWLMAGFN